MATDSKEASQQDFFLVKYFQKEIMPTQAPPLFVNNMSAAVAKVTELIGHSDKGWQEAAELAVKEASKTIRGISGVEVRRLTGKVQKGRIVEYRADIEIAYGVERR